MKSLKFVNLWQKKSILLSKKIYTRNRFVNNLNVGKYSIIRISIQNQHTQQSPNHTQSYPLFWFVENWKSVLVC